MSWSWSHPCLPKALASESFAPTAQGAFIQRASCGLGCLPQHDIFCFFARQWERMHGTMPGCPQRQGYCSKPCKSCVDGPRAVAVPCTAKRRHSSLRNACPVHCCQSFRHPISIQHTHTHSHCPAHSHSAHTHTHTPCPNPIGIQHTHPLPPSPLVPSHTTHPYSDLQAASPSPPGWPDCQTFNLSLAGQNVRSGVEPKSPDPCEHISPRFCRCASQLKAMFHCGDNETMHLLFLVS